MKNLIQNLKDKIDSIKEYNQSMEIASFGYEEGVLITGNEAQLIIDKLELSQLPDVTDEEIHNYADKVCSIADEDEPEHERIDIMLWDGFVQGAKAMRDGKITSNTK